MKKYLCYEPLCGSGIGHWLVSYNWGLQFAQANKLEFWPSPTRMGHGMANFRGEVEKYLGLPCDFERYRNISLQKAGVVFRKKNPKQVSSDFSETFDYFMDCYENRERLALDLTNEAVNICVSIRRGDTCFKKNIKARSGWIVSDTFFKEEINK
ncbi:hypothetical protein CL634_03685, partial [bacterium]|nr:hypothetical protein [bacterium]